MLTASMLARMRHGLTKWFFGLGFLSLFSGCGKPVTTVDLPGTYVANYGFATETVSIKEGGRFDQIINVKATGKVVVTNGTWRFDPEERDIVFSETFMLVHDGFGEFDPNFEHPRSAIKFYPVRRTFGKLQIGVDPAVPYKKKASPSPK